MTRFTTLQNTPYISYSNLVENNSQEIEMFFILLPINIQITVLMLMNICTQKTKINNKIIKTIFSV